MPVGTGFGCSLSVTSNVFVITIQTFTCRNKNNAPHECGNPRCQGDRVRLAIGRTIPSRLLDISRLLRLLRYPSGRAIARGASAAFGRTAPTRMRRTRRRFEYPRLSCTPTGSLLASISTHASVNTVLSKSKLPLSNFRALTVFVTDH